jgi:hypothetical protein
VNLRRARIAVLVTVVAPVLVACAGSDRSPDPVSMDYVWRQSGLPAADGDRAMVRDATWCAGRWVVVGATADAAGRTRPAVWSSRDARHWRAVALHPGGDFYTAREILTSVACSQRRLAVLGAKSGGAHGMPRTATWQERPDGSLAAVRAPYLLFGGTQSVAVAGLAGGPGGYLVTGTRTDGAAVWQSPDGASFRLYHGAPGLANTSRVRTQARAAIPSEDGWLVAGDLTDADGRLRGVVWSGDREGPWTRTELPGGSSISTGERLVETPAGPDLAGLLDQGLGLWLSRSGHWRLVERFGSVDADARAAAYVSGMAWAGGDAAAVTYSDGARFRLWVGQDVPMPTEVTVDGDRTATVAAHGHHLLLLTDDDTSGRAWTATRPRPVA